MMSEQSEEAQDGVLARDLEIARLTIRELTIERLR